MFIAKQGITDVPGSDGKTKDCNNNADNLLASQPSPTSAPIRLEISSAEGSSVGGADGLFQGGAEFISYTTGQVGQKLRTVGARKSPDLDEISPNMLQRCTE